MWEESALLFFKDLSQEEKFPSLRRKKLPPFHMITLHWHGQEAVVPHMQQMDRMPKNTVALAPKCPLGVISPSKTHTHTHTHTHTWTIGDPLPTSKQARWKIFADQASFLQVGLRRRHHWGGKPLANAISPQYQMRHREGKDICSVSLKYKKQACPLEENAI